MFDKFKEILQLSLNNRTDLSAPFSTDECGKLFDIAQKQSLVGVTFPAIEKLRKKNLLPDVETFMRWYGQTEIIK